MRKRNRNVYVRFTDAEYSQLMSRINRSGQSIQSYMVKAALVSRIYGADTYAQFKGILEHIRAIDYQLAKIGTNINQIAKLANTKKEIEKYDELRKDIDLIYKLKKEAVSNWQLLRLSLEVIPTEHSKGS